MRTVGVEGKSSASKHDSTGHAWAQAVAEAQVQSFGTSDSRAGDPGGKI